MCDGCRPLGFLLGLPFMLIALLLSVIGILLWVITAPLACCCPCLICFTAIAELGISLVKAPVNVMRWFTRQIPC